MNDDVARHSPRPTLPIASALAILGHRDRDKYPVSVLRDAWWTVLLWCHCYGNNGLLVMDWWGLGTRRGWC